MIVHHCLGCNRVTTNRIAGDDDGERILELLTEHYTRDSQLLARLHAMGIRLLKGKHRTEIRTALYGEQW